MTEIRHQVIGKDKCGRTVYIEWRENDDGVTLCPYSGEAVSSHQAIDSAKAAAIDDPSGYVGLI